VNVRVRGLDIAYERAGQGPPLVLVHGALADSRFWRRQLAGLSDEFTVVAWDEPGAGRSSDPPESFGIADYADCLAEFIDSLDLAPAHVCGLSWGGVVAQELYRRRPDRLASLILADSYAGWKGSLPEEEVAARVAGLEKLGKLPPDEFVRAFLPGVLSKNAPPELQDELLSIMADFHPVSARIVGPAVAACDQRDLLPRIGVPTLLIWGEDDSRSPLHVAERLHEAIPDARLVVIPDAGHASSMEQPDRFNAAVREFCRALAATRHA
jgi:pimeloyl-ACP methyl ester carboxylesterase